MRRPLLYLRPLGRTTVCPCWLLLIALLIGSGCTTTAHSPSALLGNLSAPATSNTLQRPITVFTAPADQVLAAPSMDPEQHLLEATAASPLARVQAPPLGAELLARLIHDLANAVRAEHGLSPLAWHDDLAPVAAAHSQDMAAHAYFGHMNQRGEDATARARRVGLDLRVQQGSYLVEGVGENLFLTHRFWEYRTYDAGEGQRTYVVEWKTAEDLARQTVEAWMNSRTHRANLLSPLYQAAAIGVVVGPNQTLFITQNLACSRPL